MKTVVNTAIARTQLEVKGGSGFSAATMLRHFLVEYVDRMLRHGFYALPSSFNTVEAFLQFDTKLQTHSLRPENEYVLHAADYFEWYRTDEYPKILPTLSSIITEGTNYCYNFIDSPCGFSITESESREFVVVSLSLVRHGNEVTMLAEFGERPNVFERGDLPKHILPKTGTTTGHERLVPEPSWKEEDAVIQNSNNVGRIVLTTILNIERETFDVRYVHTDIGPSYAVCTDEPDVLDDKMPQERRDALLKSMRERLKAYDAAFSALLTLAYLPVFVIVRTPDTKQVPVQTEQARDKLKGYIRRAEKAPDLSAHLCMQREVTWIRRRTLPERSEHELTPPAIKQEVSGSWKTLGPNDVGRDKRGNPVVGKTWVAAVEEWTAEHLETFLLREHPHEKSGPDPGIVYLMRNPAHQPNMFKVGLTRRDAKSRAHELSSATGVAAPFDVLDEWRVGNCGLVERAIHERLGPYRVNPKREFFQCSLSHAIKVIDRAINEIEVGPVDISPLKARK